MQTKFRILTRLAAVLLLSACAQFERDKPVAVTDDDAYCRGQGYAQGSKDYAACLKDRDVAASRASGSNSRIERSHRNLAEDMLNNPR